MKYLASLIFLIACSPQRSIEYGQVIRRYDERGNVIYEKRIPPTKKQKRRNFKIDPCWDKWGVEPCPYLNQ